MRQVCTGCQQAWQLARARCKMTAVPYTATYQSWHPNHISGSAAQLGPQLPGFDEQEKQVFRGCAWQLPPQTNLYSPTEAESGDNPAVYPLLPTDSVQDDIEYNTVLSCSDQYLPPDGCGHPYAPPAAQQGCVDLSHLDFAAAPPDYRAQLFNTSHTATNHACGEFVNNLTEPVHPMDAATSASNRRHGNPFWELPRTELQHNHNIAVGWPVPHCTGSMHCLSSPALNDISPTPEHSHRNSTANPVEQQQLLAEGTANKLASPAVLNTSQQLQSMQVQTSCSMQNAPVSTVLGLSCMSPDDKVYSAANGISTAAQRPFLAESAAQQPQTLNASNHQHAGVTGQCAVLEQVQPKLACCAGPDMLPTASENTCSSYWLGSNHDTSQPLSLLFGCMCSLSDRVIR